jgi:hypothetical protein
MLGCAVSYSKREMAKTVRIGSGSSYWGDMLDPAVDLVEHADIEYLGFDHLSELTLAILQRTRQKDPNRGYIPDLIPWMEATLPAAHDRGIKLITNGGGANPRTGAEGVANVARKLGMHGLKIGVLTGDDVADRLDQLESDGVVFRNMDTGEEGLGRIRDRIVAANAYLGADGIIEALAGGAELVITGRVSDNAVFVGPLMHEFGWEYRDPYWDKLGSAVIIGHLVECAENVSGAMSVRWQDMPALWQVGYPIAEVEEDGSAVITKLPGSGGRVNSWTVKEQITYEVHDPGNYIMPDAIADFTTLRLEDLGSDRVRVWDMTGKPRPKDLKVCIGYSDGWIAEGTAMFSWPDALPNARKAEEIFRHRLERIGVRPTDIRFEYLGVNALHGALAPEPDYDMNEVGLRIAAHVSTREEAQQVRREVTHLWTLVAVGSSVGVPVDPRPVVALWPTLVPRDAVPYQVEMLTV